MLRKGALIGDRYELVSSLGGGGFGEVWLAQDRRLGRAVAVKFMRLELARDTGLRERFGREARALAAISHPNVVQVYDDGEWEGRPFVVIEYVDGPTLREWYEARAASAVRAAPAEAWALYIQACDGVAAAHRRGIVHRDLKPDNVLVGRDHQGRLQARVLDFGLARVSDGNSSVSLRVGTYGYMSPEQVDESVDRVGAASDVFSLGVMLAEILTGRAVPEEGRPASWERLAVTGRAASVLAELRRAHADVPDGVWDVVERALAARPEQRYRDAQAFTEALTACWPALATSAADAGPLPSAPGAASSTPVPSVVSLRSMAAVASMAAATTGRTAALSPTAHEPDAGRRRRLGAMLVAGLLVAVISIGVVTAVRRTPAPTQTAAVIDAPRAAATGSALAVPQIVAPVPRSSAAPAGGSNQAAVIAGMGRAAQGIPGHVREVPRWGNARTEQAIRAFQDSHVAVACWHDLLGSRPSLQPTTVTVTVQIDLLGNATGASVTRSPDARFDACVRLRLSQVRSIGWGAAFAVRVPVTLSAAP